MSKLKPLDRRSCAQHIIPLQTSCRLRHERPILFLVPILFTTVLRTPAGVLFAV